MNPLVHFLRLYRLAYYQWALREIDPLHRDVPHIVRTIAHLRQQLGFAS